MQWTPAKNVVTETFLICLQHSKALDVKGFPRKKKKDCTVSTFDYVCEWKQKDIVSFTIHHDES